MRKALVAALVVAFVLSIAATASAAVLTPASFPDVKDLPCADAVAKLEGLGIAKGIDGKWVPEMPVTRAMFAAFSVRLLGLEGIVKYMVGPTKFPDVPATHWASGYVNVAVAKKLLLGYPDGNFHPDETITMAQAATVLGRLIGYVNLPGDWPSNYMVVASESGLFEGVEFTGDLVTRGDMAIMLNNALTAKRVEPKEVIEGVWTYEPVADTSKDTLLEVGFKGAVEPRFLVANADVDASLKSNEVKFFGDAEIYTMPSAVDTAALLGHKLNVIRAGKAVKYAEDVTASESIVTGSVYSASATQIKVTVDDEIVTKDFAATKFIYRNKGTADYTDLAADDDVTVLLDDDGKALVVSAFKLDADMSDKFVTAVTVKGVDGATADTVEVQKDATTKIKKEVAANATILKNGQRAKLSDVKKGDLAYIALAGGKVLYLAAYDATVSGVVSRVVLKSDGKTYITLAGGAEYKLASNVVITIDDNPATAPQLIGLNATILLNKDGAGRKITATAGTFIGKVAEDYVKDVLKVNVKGTIQSVPIAANTAFEPSTPDLKKDDIVKVTTRADGTAKSVKELTVPATEYAVQGVSASARKLTVTGAVYDVASYAALYSKAGASIELSALKAGDTVKLYLEGDVAYVVQVTTAPTTGWVQGKYVGYLKDYDTGDITVYLEVGGAMKEYTWEDGDETKLEAAIKDADEEFVKLQAADSKVVVDANAVPAINEITADKGSAGDVSILSVNDDGTVTLSDYSVLDTSKAVVYKKTTNGTIKYELKAMSDVAATAKVEVYYLLKSDGTKDTTKIGILVLR